MYMHMHKYEHKNVSGSRKHRRRVRQSIAMTRLASGAALVYGRRLQDGPSSKASCAAAGASTAGWQAPKPHKNSNASVIFDGGLHDATEHGIRAKNDEARAAPAAKTRPRQGAHHHRTHLPSRAERPGGDHFGHGGRLPP